MATEWHKVYAQRPLCKVSAWCALLIAVSVVWATLLWLFVAGPSVWRGLLLVVAAVPLLDCWIEGCRVVRERRRTRSWLSEREAATRRRRERAASDPEFRRQLQRNLAKYRSALGEAPRERLSVVLDMAAVLPVTLPPDPAPALAGGPAYARPSTASQLATICG